MFLIFADDSRNSNPSIESMGPLVSIGGFVVDADLSGELSRQIDDICDRFGFPKRQEFKWSPGRELWMRDNLIESSRQEFFFSVIEKLAEAKVTVFVCINDSQYNTCTQAESHELDVTKLFLERTEQFLVRSNQNGVMIVDRPSGDRSAEDNFLLDCIKTLEEGTDYVTPKSFAHCVVATPSKFSRMVQCTDLITGCTTARVGGESRFSPPVFDQIRPLIHEGFLETAGYGLKLHPEYKYDNLYHWILGEPTKWHGNVGESYPLYGKPFSKNPYPRT